MKNYLLLFFTVMSFTSKAQVNVEIYFYDDCKKSIINLDYHLYNLKMDQIYSSKTPKISIPAGNYILSAHRIYKDYTASEISKYIVFNDSILIIDTITIPSILFTTSMVLHDSYWNYNNCEKLCNGIEIDYYANGNKRTEGNFKEGKPIYIIEYRENGSIETKAWYRLGTIEYERLENYDENNQLIEFKVFKIKKRNVLKKTKTVTKSYDQNHKFLNKQVDINQWTRHIP